MDLTEFDEDYKQAPIEERGGSLPDGSYKVEVDRALIKDSKSGKPMLAMSFKIIDGPFKGRLLFKNAMLPVSGEDIDYNRDRVKYLKNDLHSCGVTLQNFSDLPHRLMDLIGIKLDVTAKTKNDNQNVYINKVSESNGEGLPF